MAFTTFELFQIFIIFNARDETNTAFNKRFFDNRMLWVSLVAVLALQVVAVHWTPAQIVFRTTALAGSDWAIAFAVASSILLLEEARKIAERLLSFRRNEATG
jgi:Ca2+-transporting ATPase